MAEGGQIYSTRDVQTDTHEHPERHIVTTRDVRRPIEDAKGTIYEAVAHLVIHDTAATYVGTGFLCEAGGHRWLLTAAHNVMEANPRERRYMASVDIYFGRTGVSEVPYRAITVNAELFEVPTGFVKPTKQHDWAKLNMDAYGSALPRRCFQLPPQWPVGPDEVLHLTGYPGYPEKAHRKPGVPGYPMYSLWSSECEHGWRTVFYHLAYQEWTSVGNSGSPVYYRGKDGRYYAVGIHVGFNDAMDVNMAVLLDQVFNMPSAPSPLVTKEEEPGNVKSYTPAKHVTTQLQHLRLKPATPAYLGENGEVGIEDPSDVVILNNTLVVADSNYACHVLSAAGRRTLRGVRARSLAVTTDGQLAYTCYPDDCVKVVDVDTGTEIRRFGGFEYPRGLAQNTQGQWAVGDLGGGDRRGVVICEQDGREVRRFGSYGDGKMQFNYIYYICWIDNNRLAVSDHRTRRVTVWTKSGELLTTIDSSETDMLSRPCGLCVTPSSTLLVCDVDNHCVNEFTAEGAFIRTLIRPRQDGLHHPTGIHISADGHTLAVCSLGSNTVITYTL